jgi:GAF domain-containing protein
VAGRDLTEVLDDIISVARAALPGVDAASITLIRGEQPFTAAYDGQLAMDADELQYERGYGPCVDAGRAGERFLVDDMSTEQRWPDYAKHASERGVGSSLSIPLPFQSDLLGALNNYSLRPHAFGDDEINLGEEVATWVAVASARAEASHGTERELEHLRIAMTTRAVIEQAKGVLVERYKLTPDQAFPLLSRASQTTNTKLRVVAEELVRTGVLIGSTDRR